MTELFSQLGPWIWLAVAVLLFALETIIPGVFMLWFGAAAAITGVAALLIGLTVTEQLALFGVTTLASVAFAYYVAGYGQASGVASNLNARTRALIGRTCVVAEPIRNGRGRVKVGDTLWTAEGPDADVGTAVRITNARGNALIVEPV